jgi:uncharacterized repeat protein (TIGR01451 family)
VTYTLVVTNYGQGAASGVVVNDPVPNGASLVSASSTQGPCDASVSCSVGSLAKGASATITIVVTATAAGPITNTATVAGDQKDPVGTNNGATVTATAKLRPTTLTYTGAQAGDFHDPAILSGHLVDSTTGNPIAGKLVTLTLNGNESCGGTTNATGDASCSVTPGEAAGAYTVAASFAGDTTYKPSTASAAFAVTKEETTTTYTGTSGPILNGSTVTLSGVLKEDGLTGIAGKVLTLKLGTQTCMPTTNASGFASCVITVAQPLGPGTASATFAGDGFDLPSSDSQTTLIYASATGGNGTFVIADQSTTGTVTFWGSQWSIANRLSGGTAPSAFKGFAKNPGTASCGTTWTTDPGNSAPPPSGLLPAYMSVIVTSSSAKSGSQTSGNTFHIVVVKTNPGYDADPGHPGTGTVVATIC